MSSAQAITVIGGSGFVGTRLCGLLTELGIQFNILDIKQSRAYPNVTTIVDICDLDALMHSQINGVVIHLAAVHRDDVQDKAEYDRVNVQGTENVCRAADHHGAQYIVFTSTVAVYGFADVDTDETGDCRPFNDYGRTKLEAEKILHSWKQGALTKQLAIVRPTVIFGEGNRGNVYNLLKQIASGMFVMIGNGQNKKSLAYVGNVAAFLEFLARKPPAQSTINYIDKPDVTMVELVSQVRYKLTGKATSGLRLPYTAGLIAGHIFDVVARATNRTFPISAIRVKKFCSDSAFATAKACTGFKAPYSLQEGLDSTIDAEFINPDKNRTIFYTE